MDQSILDSIKDVIGIDRSNTDFDRDLIIAINAVLFIVYQEGLSGEAHTIKDNTSKWSDILIKGQPINLRTLITWAGLKTKSIFDPPTSSTLATALKETIDELEWRGFITQNYVGEIGEI
jgi:hypothetical protein